MGLGKSLSFITTIVLNTPKEKLKDKGKTLIICPAHIANQWIQEFKKYFDTELNGVLYDPDNQKISELKKYDFVIASYTQLSESPKKLTSIEWYRVCLDEAQELGSGFTTIAKIASSLTRDISWCVTGLFYSFLFLSFA